MKESRTAIMLFIGCSEPRHLRSHYFASTHVKGKTPVDLSWSRFRA